jgi:hypothetical protein
VTGSRERLTNAVDEPALLPGAVIRRTEGDQDLVGSEAPDGVGEGAERRFVTNGAGDLASRRELPDVAQYGAYDRSHRVERGSWEAD